jgi:hypothetical protein
MLRYSIPAIVLSFVLIAPGHAACSKPEIPFCATTYNRVDTPDAVARCKGQMEDYKRAMDDYLDCYRREGRQVQDDFNTTVRDYERRTRGY